MNLQKRLKWRKDLPDFRDLYDQSPEIKAVADKSVLLQAAAKAAPAIVDLRKWCSPVEDQSDLGSCCANAAAGLLEYYENRAFGKYLNASRLFIYKTTRHLLGYTGDSGADLRSTMKAMVLFGVAPEEYWPYDISTFDNEPAAFLYSFASNYKAVQYYRLDPIGVSQLQVLATIKQRLVANLPCMFGMTVYSSFPMTAGNGDIPFPKRGEKVLGGHSMVICGYDDNHMIGSLKGALLIRNSWGTSWGNAGYGWLPYQYVISGLASDFWSLIQSNFIDTDLFK